MRRVFLIVGATAILVATAIAHGLRTERWAAAPELTAAAARLEDVPDRVGNWSSQPVELNARQLQIAQVAGHVARRYTHEPTGRDVLVLLVVGRPGVIGAHTPDVCYQGAGFRLSSEQRVQPLGSRSRSPEFSHASASKAEPRPEHLSLWWAWSTDGATWKSPSNPRGAYWRFPVLYKIYFVRPVGDPNLRDDLTPALMEELLPRIERDLVP